MHAIESLIGQLCERYTRYQSLLNEVADAIAARDEERLLVLEPACGRVSEDIERLWAELEPQWAAARVEGNPGDTSWALLESAISRAAEQLSLNQAALAQWAGEVGGARQETKIGEAALGAYRAVEDTRAIARGAHA
jgi:hypothetical protein